MKYAVFTSSYPMAGGIALRRVKALLEKTCGVVVVVRGTTEMFRLLPTRRFVSKAVQSITCFNYLLWSSTLESAFR